MAPYSIRFKASVEKDLRRIPARARRRIIERIHDLAADPRPRQAGLLTGSRHTYRVRVMAYRVVYQVDDARRFVEIEYVRHRKDAYQ